MNLRQNALALIVVTALIVIAEFWIGDRAVVRLWQLPLGLLLIGLAYERWFVSKYPVNLAAPEQRHLILGRTEQLAFQLSHAASRSLGVQWLLEAPAGVEVDTEVRELRVPASSGESQLFSVTPRRLGKVAWPAPRMRVLVPWVWLGGLSAPNCTHASMSFQN